MLTLTVTLGKSLPLLGLSFLIVNTEEVDQMAVRILSNSQVLREIKMTRRRGENEVARSFSGSWIL